MNRNGAVLLDMVVYFNLSDTSHTYAWTRKKTLYNLKIFNKTHIYCHVSVTSYSRDDGEDDDDDDKKQFLTKQ